MAPSSLKGQHAVVTGGSEGIGFAVAKHLFQLGANVTLISRTPTKLEAAKSSLKADASAEGPEICIKPVDVADADAVQKAVDESEAVCGPVDMLVCCAGMPMLGYFHEVPLSSFRRVMEVNYLGSVHAVRAVYPGMVKRNRGYVHLVSSGYGHFAFGGTAAYSPTKYAVKALAESLHNELKGTRVAVSISYPPDVDTPGYKIELDMGKPPELAEIAGAAVKLEAPEITAKRIVDGMLRDQFHVMTPDPLIWLHEIWTWQLKPRTPITLLLELLLLLLSPFVYLGFYIFASGVSKANASKRFAALREGSPGAS